MTFRSKPDGTANLSGESCVSVQSIQRNENLTGFSHWARRPDFVKPPQQDYVWRSRRTIEKIHCQKRSFVTKPLHYPTSQSIISGMTPDNSSDSAKAIHLLGHDEQHQDIWFNLASASFFVSSGTFGLLIAALRPPALCFARNVSTSPFSAALLAYSSKRKEFLHIVRVLPLI